MNVLVVLGKCHFFYSRELSLGHRCFVSLPSLREVAESLW